MAPLLYDYDSFGNIVKTTLKLVENPTPANSLVTEYAYARRQREDGVYRVTTVTRCNSQGTTYAESTAELVSFLSSSLAGKTSPPIRGAMKPCNGRNTRLRPDGR